LNSRALSAAAAVAVSLIMACSSTPEPPPTLFIAFTNDMLGSIRSCGCATKDYGGLGRRATLLREVEDTTLADFLLLEGGDFFGSEVNYGIEKADLTVRSMALMDYHGVVLGEKDLGFGVDFVAERARVTGLPVLVANLHSIEGDSLVFPASRIVKLRSGLRVGIVGVLSQSFELPDKASGVHVSDPRKAVNSEIARIGDKADFIAIVAHMDRGEAINLARQNDRIDVVVHGHGGHPMRNIRKFGNAYVLQSDTEGKRVGFAHAILDKNGRIRTLGAALTPLTKFFEDDEAITRLFESYDLNIRAKEELNVPVALVEKRATIREPFASAGACQPCHAEISAQWDTTAHAHAFDRLRAEAREFDRDCVPCHTTGFYKRGGFEHVNVTPELTGVQCEVCHGNGFHHVKDPKVKTATVPRTVCKGCHTADQTPDFEFEQFWARIHH